jgi:hypothetical protein
MHFTFGINIPWLAAFVIPAKAGTQNCKVLRGFWIPDQQTSGMTLVEIPWLSAGQFIS